MINRSNLLPGQRAIWSRDTGQRIPCGDSCLSIITWMSNIAGCAYSDGLLSYFYVSVWGVRTDGQSRDNQKF